jgi:DNA modification methylase
MREMKDKEYDLAIVDPPYGINVGTPLAGERERERE